jgi:hypothetical protein
MVRDISVNTANQMILEDRKIALGHSRTNPDSKQTSDLKFMRAHLEHLPENRSKVKYLLILNLSPAIGSLWF